MNDQLDDLLAQLARAPADHRLDQLEAGVWRRVEENRARTWQVRCSAAAVMGALAMGLAAGGTAAAARSGPEVSVFSPSAALAPSTLLGAGR